jgi:branched-chain amino acid transport system substrate-binding protein
VSRRVLCAVIAVVLAGGVAACGDTAEDTTSGSLTLTMYTSGLLHGADAPEAQDAVDAVKLALKDANGRVGPFAVNLVSLDDSDPETWRVSSEAVVTNARRAISDTNTIGWIADADAGATALTLPLLNEAGILQVGPNAGYLGFTRPAGRGEPERFYPSGQRTFARVAPADDVEAAAQVDLLREEGVERLAIVDDGEIGGTGLASLVAARAREAGMRIVTTKRIDPAKTDHSAEARAVAQARPDAVSVSATTSGDGAGVLKALHAADPDVLLVGASTLADEALAYALDAGTASRLRLTSPALPASRLGAPAERFARQFRADLGHQPAPSAVFAYEAARTVLIAIRDAGTKGNDRQAVIKAYFAAGRRQGALGMWSTDAAGDSTLRGVGEWRVTDGRLTFVRSLVPGE